MQTLKVSRLQWGRDQLIAELSKPDDTPLPVALLQWGRDQLIAELRRDVRLSDAHRKASMGPRFGARENLPTSAFQK